MDEQEPRKLKTHSRGFTLVEVLAAMLFMAIVIPVVVEAMAIANRAAVVAERSRVAAQLADKLLSEATVTNQWRNGDQTGDFEPDYPGYEWRLTTAGWNEDVMRVVSVEVAFLVQGRTSSVRLSTLVSENEQ